ncbi:protein of unknown function [Candidatus Nitrosocosmicus franklandus]|uniref:Uncharacterized protein n=1 Tax=Candidatus Nitrosocosmicus franklandianus TaxID=1798806 RepID=A0A484I5J8_9ARCH|nr:protein of unknown function [Candidatus Nitrosocosmicus franklandus]
MGYGILVKSQVQSFNGLSTHTFYQRDLADYLKLACSMN